MASVAAGMALCGARAEAIQVYALTDENDLLAFDTAAPEDVLAGGAITGLGGQDLIGIDVRASNGVLYGVGNLGGVFVISPTTRVATLVSTLNVTLQGTRFGIDFNPVVDRLRIVSNVDQNLRVNVDTGATVVDSPLDYAAGQPGATGDDPSVTAAAYTNSATGATSTSLYGIDVRSNEDRLVIQNPPNAGTLNVVGPLGVNASSLTGFDIFFDGVNNQAFAALQQTTGGISQLYSVNLATGQATLVGDIGSGDLIDGLAVVPEPTTIAALGLGAIGLLGRRRRRKA